MKLPNISILSLEDKEFPDWMGFSTGALKMKMDIFSKKDAVGRFAIVVENHTANPSSASRGLAVDRGDRAVGGYRRKIRGRHFQGRPVGKLWFGFCVLAFGFFAGESTAGDHFQIGWASTDISPEKPVLMRGGIMSTGIKDPITATVLALDYGKGNASRAVVMISCDLLHITDGNRSESNLLKNVRDLLQASLPEIQPEQVIMMATHTHVAPSLKANKDYSEYASKRIAQAAEQAWKSRKSGGISFGLGHAVVGHNRIATYNDGSSHMTGSFQKGSAANQAFSHIEGFEDHSVHLLYTWDEKQNLTGVVINVACPAQVMRGNKISADYWHDVRQLLGQSLGKQVYLLPQLSSAGDIATTVMVEKKGEKRMQELMYPNTEGFAEQRKMQIATRISNAVEAVLPYMRNTIESLPVLDPEMMKVDLDSGFPDPDPSKPDFPIEIHAIRIGDIAIVTNPFELYLDYGVRIKGRSPAIQTFLVELAGSASYLPTSRAVAGGGYGAIPKTSLVGPQAGQKIVDTTLEMLRNLWAN